MHCSIVIDQLSCPLLVLMATAKEWVVPRGATTIGPDATHPQLSVKTWGGGAGGCGGRAGGQGDWQLSRGEGLRATHYYHMHTSRVCVCV